MQKSPGHKFEDPWGITWRLGNMLRRFSLRRSLRFARGYVKGIKHQRPVFILGAPRSGTTMMFRLLSASPELGALPREGHDMWRMYHHPRYSGWQSDAVGAGRVRLGERRFIGAFLYSHFDALRFVEKTPENSLRIPYLLDLFPDAIFVIIHRNPCDVVNSLINAWRDDQDRYRSYYVPTDLNIAGHPHRRQWRFALIEGWRGLIDATIPEIALEQWRQCIDGIVSGRDLVDPDRWKEVHLETLLERPRETTLEILQHIGVAPHARIFSTLRDLLSEPANALTAPRSEKWKHENRSEIESLLGQLQPLAAHIGYELDSGNGDLHER